MKNFQIVLMACLLSSTAFATTLSEALISTYHSNPELIAAREKLKETDEEMYKAISGFLPSIKYTAQKRYSKKDTTSEQNSAGDINTAKTSPWISTKSRSTSLQLEQNVFNGGRSVMAVRMAKYYIDAGRAELLAKEEEILANAIKSFYNVTYAKEVLEINKLNVLDYEKRYETIKERVLAGVDKQADLALISANKANAYTELTIASGYYESSLASYVRDIGMEADHLVDEKLGKIPDTQIDLLKNSLHTNPQLLNVMYQQKAADINVYSKAASLLPTVDVGGSISKDWNKQSTNTQSQPYTNRKEIYFQVSVPLYNRGINYSDTRGAKAAAARLKYVVRHTKASVTQGSSSTWNEYISKKESIKSATEAVEASVVALEAMQQSYDEGISDIGTLLTAQADSHRNKLVLARVINDVQGSRYAMLSLMGTLNAKDLSLSTKLYNPAANYNKVKFELIGF